MSTCLVRQSSIQFPSITASPYFQTQNKSPSPIFPMSCRKRLYSEQNACSTSLTNQTDEINGLSKRTNAGKIGHESKDRNQRHGMKYSMLSLVEQTRHCRSAPGLLLRRKSFTPTPSKYISDEIVSQTCITFLPSLKKRKTTTAREQTMLAFQPNSPSVINSELNTDSNSIYLTCPQLAAYVTNSMKFLVIDCGSPLRHTERRILNSLLLNANDKISRKRLSTRGLKSFLDVNQLTRLNNSETIVLYDDTIRSSTLCSTASPAPQLSPAMKSIYDEMKKYDSNKQVYILQSSFDEFHQLYPALCYLSVSTDDDFPASHLPEPDTQADIELCQISEIFPGLYLGNSQDAENINILQKHQIQVVVNVSTSIPCHFEENKQLEYLRLPCHDSANQNIVQYFESTFEYIRAKLSSNKNILVHCQGGVSRSPSFVIGYLMRYHSKTFDQAYDMVRNQRKIVNPNLNFVGQLTQYEKMLSNA